jgi:hypothetical protein
MSVKQKVFCEVECLTEQSKIFSGLELHRLWFKTGDKREISKNLQTFISFNKDSFKLLEVEPQIIGSDLNVSLVFKTSKYVGAIPLRSPITGKPIGDFVVIPRYLSANRYENYIQLLELLGNDLSPEHFDTLPLASGKNFQPPIYFEALKFVNLVERLVKNSWRKFSNSEKNSNFPNGKVNWNRYLSKEYKVENKLIFPVSKNVLTENHEEFRQIKYVYNYCVSELCSSKAPRNIKLKTQKKLFFIDEKLSKVGLQEVKKFIVKNSDNELIKEIKTLGNKILEFNNYDGGAWRIDFSTVFERFIQSIFQEVAKELGAKFHNNFKIYGKSKSYKAVWDLSYVEPDGILEKKENYVYVDAKYKSHLFNTQSLSDYLKEEHRRDVHQIMAYSGFSSKSNKQGILCYPSSKLELRKIIYESSLSKSSNVIHIIGLPLEVDSLKLGKNMIVNNLNLFN